MASRLTSEWAAIGAGLWAPASQPLSWVTSKLPAPSCIVRSTRPPQLMCIWALSDPHSWDHWVLAQLREVATRKYVTQGGIELEFEPWQSGCRVWLCPW